MEREKKGQEPERLAESEEFKALNQKQRKFVLAYLTHGNASKAAIEAGYSERTAGPSAAQALKSIKVQAALRLGDKKVYTILEDRFLITKERIARELAKVGFSNMKRLGKWNGQNLQLIDSDTIDDDDAAAIKSITVSSSDTDKGVSSSMSFAVHDKVKALELLGRMKGIFDGDGDGDRNGKPVESAVQARLRALRDKYIRPGNK